MDTLRDRRGTKNKYNTPKRSVLNTPCEILGLSGCWHSIVRHENHSIRQKRSGANTLENKGIREILSISAYIGENISWVEVWTYKPYYD